MNILTLTTRHLELTPAIRAYAEKKMDSLSKIEKKILKIHVILSVEKGGQQKAEATVHIPKKQLFAESIHNDIYFSIDELERKFKEQLKKLKGKLKAGTRKIKKHE